MNLSIVKSLGFLCCQGDECIFLCFNFYKYVFIDNYKVYVFLFFVAFKTKEDRISERPVSDLKNDVRIVFKIYLLIISIYFCM